MKIYDLIKAVKKLSQFFFLPIFTSDLMLFYVCEYFIFHELLYNALLIFYLKLSLLFIHLFHIQTILILMNIYVFIQLNNRNVFY